jgi:hypothetical protein
LTVATAFKDVTYYCTYAEGQDSLGPLGIQVKARWEEAVQVGLAKHPSTAYFEKVAKDRGLQT